MKAVSRLRLGWVLVGWNLLYAIPVALAQAPAEPVDVAARTFKPEEFEQLVAPIALYSDSLLAQVLMASTYPLEVALAARWAKAHPDVKGDAVSKALAAEDWDPAVKSLVAIPTVLEMMNEKLDWTQKLGDAFLQDQKGVLDAVQRLRAKAKKAGNLESSKEQVVKTQPASGEPNAPQVIVIESSDPEVIYVPAYNPTVVYGAWAYPAYPPYYYYPPYYHPGGAFFSFSMGVIVGGAIWGNCNWGGSDVDIDIDRYNNFNRNEINHNRDGAAGDRAGTADRAGNRSGNRSGKDSKWQHSPEHRKGVGYRDTATQQKYGKAASQQGVQSRESFRGRADQGRQQMASDRAPGRYDTGANTGQYRDLGGTQGRDAQSSQRASQMNTASDRAGSSYRTNSSSAFRDVGNGTGARANSSRGGMSRGGGGARRR